MDVVESDPVAVVAAAVALYQHLFRVGKNLIRQLNYLTLVMNLRNICLNCLKEWWICFFLIYNIYLFFFSFIVVVVVWGWNGQRGIFEE